MKFTFTRASAGGRLAAAIAAGLLVVLLGPAPFARASSSCPNELFRTGPGANLPDCRAYELVSPPEKNGGEIDGGPAFESIPAPMQAALDGQAVTYGSQTTFPEANPLSGTLTTQYLSRRGPNGWDTQAITPEQDFPGDVFDKSYGSEEFSLFTGFSEDLAHAFLVANEPAPVAGAPAGYFNPYLRDNLSNGYQLLSTATPTIVPPGPADATHSSLQIQYAGMSADGSHVVFMADEALTPGALPGSTEQGGEHIQNLYEWSDGRLELISVLPGPGGHAVNARFGSTHSSNNASLDEDGNRVVSADGSRAIWTEDGAGEEKEIGQLYMSELTATGRRSVHVSASQRTPLDPEGPEPTNYWTASVNDSEVYFTSCEKLTDDATASSCVSTRGSGTSPRGEDLYRYDASTGGLSDLSVDPTPGQTADVQSVLGASEDGSYVYFVARGALVNGAPSGEEVDNFYLWHNGTLSLVATTSNSDFYTRSGGAAPLLQGEGLLRYGLTRVSSDGRYLAFESSEPLTGYDTKPVQPNACEDGISDLVGGSYRNTTGRCVEVYEYDAATGQLHCASCNQMGLPPTGDSMVPLSQHVLGGSFPGWQSTTVQQRYLLDDGRLFFDSTDALLPEASNGELNVYEYEPDGVGTCQREGGCVLLISSGTSNDNSSFLDASANGDDVFFITRQQLLARDGDEAPDVYDARADGGFASATTPPCGGEACRPAVTPAPAIYGAPPSATFVGPGNPPPPAAPKAASKSKRKPKVKPRRRRRAKGRSGNRAARRARALGSSHGRRR